MVLIYSEYNIAMNTTAAASTSMYTINTTIAINTSRRSGNTIATGRNRKPLPGETGRVRYNSTPEGGRPTRGHTLSSNKTEKDNGGERGRSSKLRATRQQGQQQRHQQHKQQGRHLRAQFRPKGSQSDHLPGVSTPSSPLLRQGSPQKTFHATNRARPPPPPLPYRRRSGPLPPPS